MRDPLRFCTEMAHSHGGLVSLNLGLSQLLLVSSPDHVEYVLRNSNQNFGKSSGIWDILRSVVGDGLATSDGALWLRQRRMMQPHFHRQRLAELTGLMTDAIEEGFCSLEPLIGSGQSVDLTTEMARVSMGVITKTIFGSSITPAETERFRRAMSVVLTEINARVWLYWLPSWLTVPGGRAYREAMRSVNEIIFSVVERHRRGGRGGGELISMLLEARDADTGEQMSDKQLRDEAFTLFIAGYETASMATSWMFYLLGKHPDVDARLKEEIQQQIANSVPGFEDLDKLVYARRVFQESLRLYPPVWIIPRSAVRDDMIGGYHVPAGTVIAVLPYAAHHDPAIWEAPETFDPDRFAPAQVAARSQFAYIPFGGGPRLCIGNNFAMMEGILLTTMALQRFHVRLVPGHLVEPAAVTILLKPRAGIRATLEPL